MINHSVSISGLCNNALTHALFLGSTLNMLDRTIKEKCLQINLTRKAVSKII